MGLISESVKHCLKHSFDFSGTTPRGVYWKFVCAVFCLFIIIGIWADNASENSSVEALLGLIILLAIIPVISATIRRIRDAGFNPWWGLLLALPGAQFIVAGMAMCRSHTESMIVNSDFDQNIKLLQEQVDKLKSEISRLEREYPSKETANGK